MHNINMSDVWSRYARRIRELRERNGLTQKEVAKLVGVGQTQIANMESGRVMPPSLALATEFARIYGTSVDYLLGLTDDATPADRLSVSRPVALPPDRNAAAKVKRIVDALPPRRRMELLAYAEAMQAAEERERAEITQAMLSLIDSLAPGDAKEVLARSRSMWDSGDVRGAVELIYQFFWSRSADQTEEEES